MMPMRMARLRCCGRQAGRSQPDHDGVVARKDQVDHQDLEECRKHLRVHRSLKDTILAGLDAYPAD